ncbi:energy transducer TonB [Endozoicomonas acroporae]|uniref:energy transducer TonB n=1 Tax=Endozoicomonas acroporae TaxID=1701104 RepID=UPI000C782476|nr:energy transducer TonB [Endozoicomonas acroporae]
MTQPATISSAAVSTADRLGFTLFMAGVLHVLIVLGVTFSFNDKPAPPPTLEVTLASYQSKEKPKEADYLAQINQQGSGTLDEKALPSSDQQAQFQEDTIKEVQPQSQTAAQPEQTVTEQTRITTRAKSQQQVSATDDREKQEPIAVEKDTPRKHIDLKNEIASLEAQFHQQRQEFAKRPRIKRLTAASTLQEAGAFYKESWRRKVEKVGNINYPEKARKQKLYGELRLMVAINRDGTLSNVEILDSSGYRVLDDAAVRIVRMASPFAPFDDTLKSYDIVEIIRTWRFEPGDRLFSQ